MEISKDQLTMNSQLPPTFAKHHHDCQSVSSITSRSSSVSSAMSSPVQHHSLFSSSSSNSSLSSNRTEQRLGSKRPSTHSAWSSSSRTSKAPTPRFMSPLPSFKASLKAPPATFATCHYIKESLELKTREVDGVEYDSTFLARELVHFLITKKWCKTQSDAVEYATTLMKSGLMERVNDPRSVEFLMTLCPYRMYEKPAMVGTVFDLLNEDM